VNKNSAQQPTADEIWNAAIAAAHKVVDDAAAGKSGLWIGEANEPPDAGDVLDRLPNEIWKLRR